MNAQQIIQDGKAVLGIEFGSTRIKAVLIGDDYMPIAQGSYQWENQLVDGIWTYDQKEIFHGLTESYQDMARDVKEKYDLAITHLAGIGISGMMHGYVAFDQEDNLLVPFRTWRNTMTGEASEKLTELFSYHIPQRWSIAHLYQAILNKEDHVSSIAHISTLAGYIHFSLTGKKVMGVGEASGMFPIDLDTKNYNEKMLADFDALVKENGYPWLTKDILPEVLLAGDDAGTLTKEGALLLDPTGTLQPGAKMCPPEGDAGTGMVATNSVTVRTGNVSAGTSVFSMIVLEKELSRVYDEIDLVTTPTGNLVGMVHCNNCTSDLNAWVGLFREFSNGLGMDVDDDKLYGYLYNKALEGDADCGGLLSYNYFSGEHVTGFNEGRPLFVRSNNAKFTLANFMRTHLYSALGALKVGSDIMLRSEGVKVDRITGHGGLFKTKGVGQGILAAALNAPISVMETAGEGGAWGMALLAAYAVEKSSNTCGACGATSCPSYSLDAFLENKVFASAKAETMAPDVKNVEGFNKFIENYYVPGMKVEAAAVEVMK